MISMMSMSMMSDPRAHPPSSLNSRDVLPTPASPRMTMRRDRSVSGTRSSSFSLGLSKFCGLSSSPPLMSLLETEAMIEDEAMLACLLSACKRCAVVGGGGRRSCQKKKRTRRGRQEGGQMIASNYLIETYVLLLDDYRYAPHVPSSLTPPISSPPTPPPTPPPISPPIPRWHRPHDGRSITLAACASTRAERSRIPS